MEKEIWKDIPGYGGAYQASNLGRVRGVDRIDFAGRRYNGKILSQNDVKGYLYTGINHHRTNKRCQVHRLIAITFLPNPNGYEQVNHKDENPKNNRVENLEWCDYLYNRNYGTRNIRAAKSHSERMKGRCPIPEYKKRIYKLSLEGEILEEYESASEAARQNGLLESKISLVCNGYRNQTGGYKWKYK